jgi:hypothetical protein
MPMYTYISKPITNFCTTISAQIFEDGGILGPYAQRPSSYIEKEWGEGYTTDARLFIYYWIVENIVSENVRVILNYKLGGDLGFANVAIYRVDTRLLNRYLEASGRTDMTLYEPIEFATLIDNVHIENDGTYVLTLSKEREDMQWECLLWLREVTENKYVGKITHIDVTPYIEYGIYVFRTAYGYVYRDDKPAKGVSVSTKWSSYVTDENGYYQLLVPENEWVTISYDGYTKEIYIPSNIERVRLLDVYLPEVPVKTSVKYGGLGLLGIGLLCMPFERRRVRFR